MYAIGYDIGSSSIKAALVDIALQKVVARTNYPKTEMTMISHHPGWAEQDPAYWWFCLCKATHELLSGHNANPNNIKCIGLAYQMHGLVVVDKQLQPLRPSIIWCDSRAVAVGAQAWNELGQGYCLNHILNSPGNFTASKLRWLKINERALFDKIHKVMLPGDFIAAKMTEKIHTTISGLSEGILWDFKEKRTAKKLLDYFEIPEDFIPALTHSFGHQGALTRRAAEDLGLKEGTPIAYRAGDQPNNALSLHVMDPGEIAATGGTSGVIYAIADQLIADPQQRVNSFAHVNYSNKLTRIGVLLCINGAGIMYKWIKNNTGHSEIKYSTLEKLAAEVPVGCQGLQIFPFGNGAERMLQNRNLGVSVRNLQLNIHGNADLTRAALEGIAFAFVFGVESMKSLGIPVETIRVGNDNLFQSAIFSNTISTLLDVKIEVLATTGAVGAALASAYGMAYYRDLKEAFSSLEKIKQYTPETNNQEYLTAYSSWKHELEALLQN